MFTTSIRSHVMKAVNEMISEVQKKYDADIDNITREAEEKKMVAREVAVESIVSKFR